MRSAAASGDSTVQGIGRREPRVLVGRDAVQASWLQRLFPVRYWSLAARDLARRTRGA